MAIVPSMLIVITTLVVAFYALLFLSSAISKLANISRFRRNLGSYGLNSLMAAYTIVGAELLVGGGLLIGVATSLFLLAAAILIVAFSLAMLRLLRSGTTVGCGCGGLLGSEPVGRASLRRNAVLVVIALFGLTVSTVVPRPTGVNAALSPMSLSGVVWTATTAAIVLVALAVGFLEARPSIGARMKNRKGSTNDEQDQRVSESAPIPILETHLPQG